MSCPPEGIIGQLLIGMVTIQAMVSSGASGHGGTYLSEGLHTVSRRWHLQMHRMHPPAFALQLLLLEGTQVATFPPCGAMEWHIL